MTNYSLADIKAAWKVFEDSSAFCVMKDGKWTNTPLINGYVPASKIDGTAAKVRFIKDVMDFPEFLEKHFK